jgi:hypothetical protein
MKESKWWTIGEDKNCDHRYRLVSVNGPTRSRPIGKPNAIAECTKCKMRFATESITTRY